MSPSLVTSVTCTLYNDPAPSQLSHLALTRCRARSFIPDLNAGSRLGPYQLCPGSLGVSASNYKSAIIFELSLHLLILPQDAVEDLWVTKMDHHQTWRGQDPEVLEDFMYEVRIGYHAMIVVSASHER